MRGDGIKIEGRHSMRILELERLLSETRGKLHTHIEHSNNETKKLKIIIGLMLLLFVASWSISPNTHLANATDVNNIVKHLLHK